MINSVQIRKMTKFQKCLASITVSRFDSGREVSKTPGLLNDFPEILEGTGFADSIYDRIYGNMDWESARTDECLVSVGDRNVTYKSEFIEVKLDLPRYFAHELIDGYERYAAQDEKYEKEEVLDKAVGLFRDKLTYMHSHLQQTAIRGLLDSHNLMIAYRRDFGGKLSLEEERRESDRHFKIKFPPGRKPAELDKSVKQAAIGLYNELLAVLAPDFDGKSEYKKSKVCKDVVSQYKSKLHLRYEKDVEKLALKLNESKKSVSAGVFLTAKMLSKSERQIRRYLSDK